MHDGGKGIDRFAVHEDFHPHEIGDLMARHFIIHGTIAACDAFQSVVEIDQYLVEWQVASQQDAGFVDGLGAFADATLFGHKREQVADRIVGRVQASLDHGFLDEVDLRHFR